MNRRSFFKVVGSLTAASLVPTFLVEIVGEVKADGIGLIRELVAYDIYHDEWIIRHDILVGDTQWFVDQRLYGREEPTDLRCARDIAHILLEKRLKESGHWWTDLTYLPIP